MKSHRSVPLMVALALLGCFLGGCHRSASATGTNVDAAVSAPFTVREDSEGLLFTWIDEKGDFHVEEKVKDVPIVGRDAVRAVDPTREETAHGDMVYVADLRVANLDGSYPVHTMTRDDFDALAVTRREKGESQRSPRWRPTTRGRPEHRDPPTARTPDAPPSSSTARAGAARVIRRWRTSRRGGSPSSRRTSRKTRKRRKR